MEIARDEPAPRATARSWALAIVRALLWPWRSRRLGRSLAHEALSIPIGSVTGMVFLALAALCLVSTVTFVLAVPVVLGTVTLADWVARAERARAHALLYIEVPVPHATTPAGLRRWARVRTRMTRRSSWKEVAYLAVVAPLLGIGAGVVLTIWSLALALLTLPAYAGSLPGGSADLGFARVAPGLGAALACLVGLGIGVLLAPLATAGLASIEGTAVRGLLGPPARDELTARVGALETSRAAAVDSAETERRRIERDLHDGVQQRLASLAMELGRARERFATDPSGAETLVAGAHEDAKAALSELREVARGVHPAILTDRGLDAALSSVVARCPIPVELSVEVETRPPAPIESAAYFVVSEALTNVVKHAQASRVRIAIARQDDRLAIAIDDDGVGGAAVGGSGGLAGLSERVTALGGWLRVLSPAGGPTSVIVELPCGS
jgi:signal transduction histidine kinase